MNFCGNKIGDELFQIIKIILNFNQLWLDSVFVPENGKNFFEENFRSSKILPFSGIKSESNLYDINYSYKIYFIRFTQIVHSREDFESFRSFRNLTQIVQNH